jgi:catechol-2,3-dioxygenase
LKTYNEEISMTFEHFALNVKEPVKMAQWYIDNCGMRIVRSMEVPPFTRFLADESGHVVMELYSNDTAKYPDHKNAHPLEFHFALKVDDAETLKHKLIAAGAAQEEEIKLDDGSHLVMLRDPFGIPLQLCKRGKPMV